MCIGHRGLLRLWVEVEGQAVHSGSDAWSRGEAGVNAVTGLSAALLALEGMTVRDVTIPPQAGGGNGEPGTAGSKLAASAAGGGSSESGAGWGEPPTDAEGRGTSGQGAGRGDPNPTASLGNLDTGLDHLAGLGLTVTPGTLIEGGEFESMVPAKARAAVDIRIPPGITGTEVLAEIEAQLAKVRSARPGLGLSVTVKNDLPAAMIPPDHPLAQLAQKHARALFGGDWPIRIAGPANEGYMLIGAGIPTLPGFGPEGGNAHAPDEWVALDSLPVSVAVYASIIRDYLNM